MDALDWCAALFHDKWRNTARVVRFRAARGGIGEDDVLDILQNAAMLLWTECLRSADPTIPAFQINVGLIALGAHRDWKQGNRQRHTPLSQCGSTTEVYDPPGPPLTVKVDGVDMGVVDAKLDHPAAYRLAVADDWLNGSEVARLLGISRQRVHQLAKRLGGMLVRGHWRFPHNVQAVWAGMRHIWVTP
jgi:hypothetical protein